MTTPGPQTVGSADAARIAGLSVRTIQVWCRTGFLRSRRVHRAGKVVAVIDLDDLRVALNRHHARRRAATRRPLPPPDVASRLTP